MCPRENKGQGFQMFLWELYASEFLHVDHLFFNLNHLPHSGPQNLICNWILLL